MERRRTVKKKKRAAEADASAQQKKQTPQKKAPKQAASTAVNTTQNDTTKSKKASQKKPASQPETKPVKKKAAPKAAKTQPAPKKAPAQRQSRPPVVQKQHTGRKVLDILASLVVLGGFCVAVGYPLVTGMVSIDTMTGEEALGTVQTDTDAETAPDSTEAATDSEQTVFDTVAVKNEEVYSGSLLLVNSDHAFQSDSDADIATLFEEKTDSYSVSGMDISMHADAITPLNDMLDAFYAETGHDEVLIVDGYRTQEQQQLLYDEDLEQNGTDTSTLVAVPGHSEHETGFALDFSLFFADGTSGDYDGTGDYAWINEHCADYGYILRYPEEKTDLTGIQYEPWHYRYVGRPHAYYIMESGLCLEEYIDLLRDYSAESPLEIVDSDGAAYAVYYVEADTDASVTYVSLLPDHPYTISGNNVDGFIVTVDLEETREPVSYAPVTTTTTTGSGDASTEDEKLATTTETTVVAVG
jgi:D-alanyl-D-alanine carboxypeptidase